MCAEELWVCRGTLDDEDMCVLVRKVAQVWASNGRLMRARTQKTNSNGNTSCCRCVTTAFLVQEGRTFTWRSS